MTGQMFGSDTFQLSYSTIASAQVKFGFMSGYFEVSAGGMQNTEKSYWSSNKRDDPKSAPNCVSLISRSQANVFRKACTFISEQIDLTRQFQSQPKIQPSVIAATDIASALEKLWKLKSDGAIDQAEFEAAKRQLLSSSLS